MDHPALVVPTAKYGDRIFQAVEVEVDTYSKTGRARRWRWQGTCVVCGNPYLVPHRSVGSLRKPKSKGAFGGDLS
jgi:hypothetical protein